MLKITAVLIIFFSCSYFGYYYGETFKNRSRQLKSILKAILFLNNEVIYSNSPLPEAIEYVALKVEEPIRSIMEKAAVKLKNSECSSVLQGFAKAFKEHKNHIYLNEEDKRIIKDFLRSLGETGVYGQDKLFNMTIENLKINSIEAEELAKRNIKMYRAIGISIGAMIAIFII